MHEPVISEIEELQMLQIDLYEAHETIDSLQKLLALSVSIMEAAPNNRGLIDSFLNQANKALVSYYQTHLPIDQYLAIHSLPKE